MYEDESKKLAEISETLSMLNDVMDAIMRVMGNPNPDSDDVAFLEAFASDALNDEEDEWVDDTWDEAMVSLPQRIMLVYKGDGK